MEILKVISVSWRSWMPLWILTALLYVVLGKICVALGTIGGTASPFWLPAGLVMVFSLRFGYRALPGIFLGEFLLSLFFLPGPVWKAVMISVGNVLEGAAVAYLAPRWMRGHDPFESIRNFFSFFAAAAVGSSFNATLGVASLWLSGFIPLAAFGSVMLGWSVGDLGGTLIMAPLLLSWYKPDWGEWRGMALVEFLILLAASCAMSYVVISDISALPSASLTFLLLPLLLWSAFRFGLASCALVNALMMAIVIWGTTRGHGPFVSDSATESLMLIQLFTSVLIVTALLAFIVNRDRQRMTDRLRMGAEILEEKVKQRTAELREAMLVARSANQAKSVFLANMSHEIRTPLNAVLGLAHLLGLTELSSPQRDYLRKIEFSSRALLGILNDILDFSKIEAGRLELERAPFLLRDVIETLDTISQANLKGKPVELMFDLDADVPPCLTGDRLRLQQVLINLLANASKFTQQGTIVLRIHLQEQKGDALKVKFSVQDTGIGMTEEQRERLFQPFIQADLSTTRRFGGTGLGLAICQRLIGLMGGQIEVQTRPGEGSDFYFTIALERGVMPVEDTDEGARRKQQAGTVDLGGIKLLLVEDNAINRVVATEVLTRSGADVVTAENGRDALTKLDGNITLVLMDLQMPEMDGLEATRHIRAQPGFAHIPIIAMTANVDENDVRACIEAGMNDHIGKPFDVARLNRVVARWAGREGAPPEVRAATGGAREEAPAESLPVLDKEKAIARMGIDEAVYLDVLEIFPDEYLRMLGHLTVALENQAWPEAQREVHTIKGLAANIGAEALAE